MHLHRIEDITIGFTQIVMTMYVWADGRQAWSPGEPGDKPDCVATIQVIDDCAYVSAMMRHTQEADKRKRERENRVVLATLRAHLKSLGLKRWGMQRPDEPEIKWRNL